MLFSLYDQENICAGRSFVIIAEGKFKVGHGKMLELICCLFDFDGIFPGCV